jgi:hypothetical protein
MFLAIAGVREGRAVGDQATPQARRRVQGRLLSQILNSKCPLTNNNEAAPDAGPLFFLRISCGRRTQPNPARVLCYFFFDLAFFFMTLFLAVGPSPDRKDGVGQMNAA